MELWCTLSYWKSQAPTVPIRVLPPVPEPRCQEGIFRPVTPPLISLPSPCPSSGVFTFPDCQNRSSAVVSVSSGYYNIIPETMGA